MLSAVAFLLYSADIFSQESDTTGSDWALSASTEGLYQSGNTSKLYVNAMSELKRADRFVESILGAYFGYGESKGKKDANDLSATFTTDLFYKNKWSPFILQYTEYNFGSGIDIRSQSGAGIKYVFIEDPDHRSSVSVAGIYDYTNLADKPGNFNNSTTRLSLRLRTRQIAFDDKLQFSFTAYYQPSLNNFKNVIIRFETNLKIPLSKHFSINSTYRFVEDDVVSVGRKRVDTKVTFGVGINY